jgi:hypothetical protein
MQLTVFIAAMAAALLSREHSSEDHRMICHETTQEAPQNEMVILIITLHQKVRCGSTEILIPNTGVLPWKTQAQMGG